MKPFAFLALALVLAVSAASASAQNNPPQPPPNAGPMAMPMQQHMCMHPMVGMHEDEGMGPGMMHGAGSSGGMPTEPGQTAFGAIQEIARMLLTDPMTNWSKVNIDAPGQHLVDMDELTLHADAKKEPIKKRLARFGDGQRTDARSDSAHGAGARSRYQRPAWDGRCKRMRFPTARN